MQLDAGTTGETFREKVKRYWLPQIAAFDPQLIFFSAGFDAHTNDPLADIRFMADDYVWITQEIAKIADVHCAGKIVSVLEGGYNLEVLAECAPLHVKALII